MLLYFVEMTLKLVFSDAVRSERLDFALDVHRSAGDDGNVRMKKWMYLEGPKDLYAVLGIQRVNCSASTMIRSLCGVNISNVPSASGFLLQLSSSCYQESRGRCLFGGLQRFTLQPVFTLALRAPICFCVSALRSKVH